MEFENHARRMPWSVGETPHEHSALWPPTGEDGCTKSKLNPVQGHRSDFIFAQANTIKGMLMKWVKEDEQAKAWACVHAVVMSIMASAFFVAMTVTWFAFYRYSIILSAFVFLLFLVSSMSMIVWGWRKREDKHWVIALGFLCILMTFVGLLFGFFMYYGYLVYYFRYQEMHSISNVRASTSVRDFNDASMFLFSRDTRLDVQHSVGFKSRWSADTYCVAPVIDSTMTNANAINFWAVGENCCSARGNFACSDARDAATMSALVVLQPEDVVRPFMMWAVAGSAFPRYMDAINLQQAAYATRAARNLKMLYWVRDPVAQVDQLYYDARNNSLLATFLVWASLLVVSYIVCYKWRWLKPRADKRLDESTTAANPAANTA